MDIEWRTVQFFLEEDYVAEVQVDDEDKKKVRCTCEKFSKMARCKHTAHVKKRIAENGGNYTIVVPSDVPEEVALHAMQDREAFREFLIWNATVEVLDEK